MSSSATLGRHRAAPVHSNPLAVISQAVSSNAGSVGRQAAVIAAASGLVLTVGLPAQASEADRAADTLTTVTASQAQAVDVSVPAATEISFERASVTSEAAPTADSQTTVASNETEEVAGAEADAQSTEVAEASEPAPEPAPEPAAAVSSGNSSVAGAAYAGIGNPYVYGGTSPTAGWDCSGFTQWAYAQAGVSIPRTNQWGAMTPTSNPKPGDLVVQSGGSHVGIYVGNGQMISALNPSDGTQLHSVSAMPVSGYYTIP